MKKSKILALLMSAILVVTMFAACGSKDAPAADTQADSSDSAAAADTKEDTSGKKDVLVMATEATFVPYEYMQGTEIVGIDVDIANEIAKEMGVELVIENMNFDAIIPAVNSGKADFGAAGMSITEKRLQEVDFSVEYATSKQVILTKPDMGVAGVNDINGKVVGVQMGTTGDIILSEDYPDVELVQLKKFTDLGMELTNGNIDAVVLDSLTAEEMAKTNEEFIILEEPLATDVYAICVAKGNQELLDTINTVLERLMTEGKIEEYTIKHTTDA